MKRKLLRIVGLLLLPLMLFMILPVTAHADSALDGAISITVENDNSTLYNTPSLTVDGTTATAKATVGSGLVYRTVSYTVTITNNSAGKLSFKWSVANSASFKDPNGGSTVSGTYSKDLTAGSSLTMQVKASSKSTTATLTISELAFEEASGKNTTFNFNSNGTVSVAGTAIASGSTHLLDANGVSLTATPKSGYSFLGWVKADTRAIISRDATFTYGALEETTIEAVFVNKTSDTAWFLVDNTYLVDNLTTAGSKGTKIVLMNDGTLSGSHTIAAGDTLLIPCDDAHTVYTTKPGDDGGDTYAKTEVYRKLTMAQGASITVNGAISIGGKIGTNMTGQVVSTAYYFTNGAPSGPLGYISMNNDSNITVNSGGNLYAWGFVTGSGAVTVKSGGSIYENFQIRDYRGGSCTSAVLKNKDTYEVFPFSQYYIQNVECPLTLEAGATQNVCTAVSYSVVINTKVSKENAVFLGSDSGLIRLSSGSLTRTYDGSTDRIIYDLNGDISFANLSIAITISAGASITINSEDYIMPLNSNMTLNVNSGSNVTMNQDFFLLPGAILEIGSGSNVTIGSEKRLFVYDSTQWGGYTGATNNSKLVTVYFAPGRTGTRSESSLVDAKLIVNGTLDATSGHLYTTASGANITSDGNGVVKATKGTQTVAYQITQNGTDPSYPEIAITPAQLLNSDGTTYVATGTSTASPNTYTYVGGKWVCEIHTDADADNVCDVCGVTICDHANTELQNVKEATCTEDGYSGDKVCTACGTTVETGTVITAAGSHSGGTATCTEKAKCGVCSQEYGELADHAYADPVVNFSDDGTTYTVTVTCPVCAEGITDHAKTSDPLESKVKETTPGDCKTNSTTTYEASGEFEGVTYSDTKIIEGALGAHTPAAAVEENRVESTCTVAGSYDSVVYCSSCNTELSRETKALELAAHTGGAVVVENEKAATCTAEGSYDNVVYCTVCNAELSRNTVTVEKIAHTPAAAVEENRVESTCTVAGSYEDVIYCSECKAELSRETKPLELAAHTEGAVVVENEKAATCTAEGSYDNVVYCTVCNAELSRNTVTVEKIAHTPAAAVKENRVESTCTVAGSYDSVVYCSSCNTELSRETKALELAAHTGGAVVVENEKAATCTAEGSYDNVVYCTVCNAELSRDTVTVEKIAHTPAAAVKENRVESTCTVAGSYDSVVYCSSCNTELSRETKALELAAHTEGAVVVENEVAATCTAEGSYDNVVYCTVCDAELSRNTVTVEKIAHTPAAAVEEKRVESTCTVAGSYDSVVYCSSCNTELSRETKALELAAHTEGAVVVENEVAATCTAEGSYDNVVYCTVCDAELSRNTVTVEKIAHTPAAAVEENRVESTCTVAGSYEEVIYCSVCKTELSRETKALELAAHTEGETVVENNVDATCTAEGSYDNVVYCTVCKAELSRGTVTVEKIAHTPDEAVEENRVESTCTVAGSYDEVVYCSECDEELSRETKTLELAAHTPGNAVEENRQDATTTEAGRYDSVVYCSICSTEISRETVEIPKLEAVGTTVSGTVKAYNKNNAPEVKLYANGVEKYPAVVAEPTTSGSQYTWTFTFSEVEMGSYDLVIKKDGHLTYTVTGVQVTDHPLDLSVHSDASVKVLSMLAGNMNSDSAINNSDLIAFRAQFGKSGNNISNPLANINGDIAVNNSDLIIFKSNFGKTTTSCTIPY